MAVFTAMRAGPTTRRTRVYWVAKTPVHQRTHRCCIHCGMYVPKTHHVYVPSRDQTPDHARRQHCGLPWCPGGVPTPKYTCVGRHRGTNDTPLVSSLVPRFVPNHQHTLCVQSDTYQPLNTMLPPPWCPQWVPTTRHTCVIVWTTTEAPKKTQLLPPVPLTFTPHNHRHNLMLHLLHSDCGYSIASVVVFNVVDGGEGHVNTCMLRETTTPIHTQPLHTNWSTTIATTTTTTHTYDQP